MVEAVQLHAVSFIRGFFDSGCSPAHIAKERCQDGIDAAGNSSDRRHQPLHGCQNQVDRRQECLAQLVLHSGDSIVQLFILGYVAADDRSQPAEHAGSHSHSQRGNADVTDGLHHLPQATTTCGCAGADLSQLGGNGSDTGNNAPRKALQLLPELADAILGCVCGIGSDGLNGAAQHRGDAKGLELFFEVCSYDLGSIQLIFGRPDLTFELLQAFCRCVTDIVGSQRIRHTVQIFKPSYRKLRFPRQGIQLRLQGCSLLRITSPGGAGQALQLSFDFLPFGFNLNEGLFRVSDHLIQRFGKIKALSSLFDRVVDTPHLLHLVRQPLGILDCDSIILFGLRNRRRVLLDGPADGGKAATYRLLHAGSVLVDLLRGAGCGVCSVLHAAAVPTNIRTNTDHQIFNNAHQSTSSPPNMAFNART